MAHGVILETLAVTNMARIETGHGTFANVPKRTFTNGSVVVDDAWYPMANVDVLAASEDGYKMPRMPAFEFASGVGHLNPRDAV